MIKQFNRVGKMNNPLVRDYARFSLSCRNCENLWSPNNILLFIFSSDTSYECRMGFIFIFTALLLFNLT